MATAERQLATHLAPMARTGGKLPRSTRFERHENVRTSAIYGSHMPIDTEAHWTWRNPLNILPALLLVFFLIGIIGTMVTLL